ncbi:hypothetical protein GGH95_006930, partial [Coemansia sp. RSA 1836]
APTGGDKYYANNGRHDEVVRQYPAHDATTSHNPHRCTSRCVVYTAKQSGSQAGRVTHTQVAARSPHADHLHLGHANRGDDIKPTTLANLAGAFAPDENAPRALPRKPETGARQHGKARYCCSQHQQIDDDDVSYREASIHEHAPRSTHSNEGRSPIAPFAREQTSHDNGENYNDEYVS